MPHSWPRRRSMDPCMGSNSHPMMESPRSIRAWPPMPAPSMDLPLKMSDIPCRLVTTTLALSTRGSRLRSTAKVSLMPPVTVRWLLPCPRNLDWNRRHPRDRDKQMYSGTCATSVMVPACASLHPTSGLLPLPPKIQSAPGSCTRRARQATHAFC